MKNIHILPTPNPSYLYKMSDGSLNISDLFEGGNSAWKNQNIYITNSEEIKDGDWTLMFDDWCIDDRNALNKIINVSDNGYLMFENGNSVKNTKCKKIILTTDTQLIKDGIQTIPDEFLEWFIKNPSCEEVEVIKQELNTDYRSDWKQKFYYKIIIPKEEPKQETLEEAAERLYPFNPYSIGNRIKYDEYAKERRCFIEGAKWQQERSYSEEDLKEAYFSAIKSTGEGWNGEYADGNHPNIEEKFTEGFEEWFERNKKK